MRLHPNIAIAGNPGTGKTTCARKLADRVPDLKIVDVNAEAASRDCRESFDQELQAWVIDEDKLAEALEPELEEGGNIIDWMHADFWPEDGLIDLVVTLRASNTILFDRYTARDYAHEKIQQNLDSEIMNDIGLANSEYFGTDTGVTAVELQSDTDVDMEENLKRISAWVTKWQQQLSENGGTVDSQGDQRRVSF